MENPETFPPGGRPQHQNHPIPSNWYDTLDRNANISLNSKGLRNAPGENNCFLNSAVQVRNFFSSFIIFSSYHMIMYWGQRNGERKIQIKGCRPQKFTGEDCTESGIISRKTDWIASVLSSECIWITVSTAIYLYMIVNTKGQEINGTPIYLVVKLLSLQTDCYIGYNCWLYNLWGWSKEVQSIRL